MNLLEKYQANVKNVENNIASLEINVTNVSRFKDERKLIIDTDKGRFFPWKSAFRNIANLDSLPNKFKATITLIEKGEYVNISEIFVDLESLGKFNFVATNKLAVAL